MCGFRVNSDCHGSKLNAVRFASFLFARVRASLFPSLFVPILGSSPLHSRVNLQFASRCATAGCSLSKKRAHYYLLT